MGTEKAATCHVACGPPSATSKQASSRRRGSRARRTKDRRAGANHTIPPIVVAAEETAVRQSLPLEASRATDAIEVAPPPLCEASVVAADVPRVDQIELPGCKFSELEEPLAAEAEATEALSTRASSSSDLASEAELVEAPRAPPLRRRRTWPLSVSFDDSAASVQSITPYAEVYGMHPRLFDFGKNFSMVPALGFGAARQAMIAATAEVAARQQLAARIGEDAAARLDEEEGDAGSEDSSDDDDDDGPCTEYHLAPPRNMAQAEPPIAAC